MKEQWKKIFINGQVTVYSVSNLGRVRNDKKMTMLEGYVNNNGYSMVHLRNRIDKMCSVHRLVMKAFEPCEEMDDLQINHIDGDKQNNTVSNLEWCDALYNVRHAFRTGLQPKEFRETYCYDLDGNFLKGYECATDAAKDLNIDESNILRCLNEEQSHYLSWQFKSYKKDKIDEWSNPHKNQVYVYFDNGQFYKAYKSQVECAKDLGLGTASVSRYIRGIRKLPDFVFSRIPL
uniref:Homing endonuclease n=1 Tax=Siphoviridae sp. ctZHD14 TaxID=2827891 RepID=A0A8S5SWW2_9CAUD|nr:MAG TPA: homing endonuclease [Siphoviridae sp. ctZHD14]